MRTSRPLSDRQKLYRKYLQSDHWAQLRASAIERDGGKCVVCESEQVLQVHHLKYREKWEDGILEDVETLCILCHRNEHGFGPDVFQRKLKAVSKNLLHEKFPTKEDEAELVRMADLYDDEESKREVRALFRQVAGMRIIMTSSVRWSSWLKKGREVQHRLWPWAERKYERILESVKSGVKILEIEKRDEYPLSEEQRADQVRRKEFDDYVKHQAFILRTEFDRAGNRIKQPAGK